MMSLRDKGKRIENWNLAEILARLNNIVVTKDDKTYKISARP